MRYWVQSYIILSHKPKMESFMMDAEMEFINVLNIKNNTKKDSSQITSRLWSDWLSFSPIKGANKFNKVQALKP